RARTFRTARHRRSRSAFQVPILSCGNRRVRTEAWQGERRAPTFPARARAGPERRGAPLFGEALARVRLERRLVLGRTRRFLPVPRANSSGNLAARTGQWAARPPPTTADPRPRTLPQRTRPDR